MESSSSSSSSSKEELVYANKHIPQFLQWEETKYDETSHNNNEQFADINGLMQIVYDGNCLTSENLYKQTLDVTKPILVVDTPESIGMKIPRPKKSGRNVTVRDIANVIDLYTPVSVIDVEYQEELNGWTFADLVDYFEDEERLAVVRRNYEESINNSNNNSTTTTTKCAMNNHKSTTTTRQYSSKSSTSSNREQYRRKASIQFINKTKHRVLNQISFEFSKTKLKKYVKSPKFVRDIDWIDNCWPTYWRYEKHIYPIVQYYCLTSSAGCYTDFHIDFGGTSVWYHVLSGIKQFILIQPTIENLYIYEQWLCKKDQANIFLPDMLQSKDGIFKITLQQNQTFIIPSGWIHAVYTPIDSLVFGGNYLHGLDMQTQLNVHNLEVRTKVLEKFRFPYFISTHFYAIGIYYNKLCQCDITKQELDGLPVIIDAVDQWWKVQPKDIINDGSYINEVEPSIIGSAFEAARCNGFTCVNEFLLSLQDKYNYVKNNWKMSSIILNNNNKSIIMTKESYRMNSSSPTINNTKIRFNKLNSSLYYEKQSLSSKSNTTEDSSSSSSFRIKLSSASRINNPLPKQQIIIKRHTTPREDMASYVNEKEVLKDDEWKPTKKSSSGSSSILKRNRIIEKSCSSKKKRHSSSSSCQTSNDNVRKIITTKPKTTSRQRLLKKAKW